MTLRRDLTNQWFGDIFVIELSDKVSGKAKLWKCRCSCGTIEYVQTGQLTSRDKQRCRTCGIKARINHVDLTGQKFGRLTVKSHESGLGCKSTWKCVCECGNELTTVRTNLWTGVTKQCKNCSKIFQKRKELDCQRFGNWTVIRRTYLDTGFATGKWFCKCDCGTEKEVSQSDLLNGSSTKCPDCAYNQNSINSAIDLSNQTFGKWTVLERAGTSNRRKALWLCRCECGKKSKVVSGNLINGVSTCCGKCETYGVIKGNTWKHIIRGARVRNIEFNITKEEAHDLFIEQGARCALTGREIILPLKSNTGRTASLDRIDSNGPYSKENCQWVHKDINRMKWIFDNYQFRSICREVVEHSELTTIYTNDTDYF